MFGSYLLDKNRWSLVFDCVRAMTAALKQKKKTCDSHNITKKVNDVKEKEKDEDEKNGCGKVDVKYGDQKVEILDKEVHEDEDSSVIPLLCKIRICEDGVNSYKATEAFCKGAVSCHTVCHGLRQKSR